VSELDLPFSIGKDGHIIGDYFNFVCSFASNEIREHCANERRHSAIVVWIAREYNDGGDCSGTHLETMMTGISLLLHHV